MVMGPTCGMILGDLGAEVIKVEPPGGDKTRRLIGSGAGFFRLFNRNKKSVTADLTDPKDRARIAKLIALGRHREREFPPRRADQIRLRLRVAEEEAQAADLRLAQGLPARPLRASRRARRGGADDGRACLHDRPARPAAARRLLGQRHHGRHVRRDRRARGARRARSAPARARRCRSGCSRTACCSRRSTCCNTPRPASPRRRCRTASMPGACSTCSTPRTASRCFSASSPTPNGRCSAAPSISAASRTIRGLPTTICASRRAPGCCRRCARSSGAIPPRICRRCSSARGCPTRRSSSREQLFDDPHLLASGGLADLTLETGETTPVPLLPLLLDGRHLKPRMPIAKVGEHDGEV